MPSTVIHDFSYSPESRELQVHFVTGRIYIYSGVPEREVEALKTAESKGRYFNAHIRNRYEYREVTGAF